MKKVSVVLLLCGFAMASAPEFGPYSWIEATGGKIDVGYYGAPCIADWNNDGLKDLVLGQFTNGKIRFYANSNTNILPIFTSYTFIQSDGTDIILPAG